MSSNSKANPIKHDPQRLFLRNILRKIFLEDWLLKLFALAITFGLWIGVTGLANKANRRLTVQLVTSVANNVKIIGNIDSEIDIVVAGDERKVKSMSTVNLVASLDLTEVAPGERVIALSSENISVSGLPEGIKVEEVPIRRIAVRIEEVEEVDLPVSVDLMGKPTFGYEVYGDPIIVPQRIRVRGPISGLNSIRSLVTDPIDLNGKTSDFSERQVRVKFPPDMMASDTVVSVSVRIGEVRLERTLSVPISGSSSKKTTVTLFGPKSAILSLKPESLRVEMVRNESGQETPQLTLSTEQQQIIEVRKIKSPAQ